jgi:hypothetical protein
MIRIEQGSIFDEKCDLLVVPCDSGGGVTTSVFQNLEDRGLPTRIGTIPFGHAHFREVRYENASTLAYAASVDGTTISSSRDAIASIAREIRRYCELNSVLSVNIPLLGSGAGGMSPIESFNAMREELESDPRSTYCIFCFAPEAYKNITAAFHPSSEAELPRPRVFISYAGNNAENVRWVKKIATFLRNNGIDARLDAFHLKPGFDLPQWMTNEVILANKVLLICDSHYMQKADFRRGGVGWETMIIQGDMLAQGDNKQKYIAIVREDSAEKGLPIYIRSKFALNWGNREPSPDQLQELVLLLFDCDNEPELGAVPEYVRQKLRKSVAIEIDAGAGTPNTSRRRPHR